MSLPNNPTSEEAELTKLLDRGIEEMSYDDLRSFISQLRAANASAMTIKKAVSLKKEKKSSASKLINIDDLLTSTEDED